MTAAHTRVSALVTAALLALAASLMLAAPASATPACASGTDDGNGFCYTASGGEVTIVDYIGGLTDLTGANALPTTIGGDPVTAIGPSAFKLLGLTAVSLPSTVTFIGFAALSNNALVSVELPASLETIEGSAFYLNSLQSIIIPPSVETIGSFAFINNSLEYVSFPDSLTTIGDAAFSNNSLASVTIPASVSTIGDYAFAYNALTSVIMEGNEPGAIGTAIFTGQDPLVTFYAGATFTSGGPSYWNAGGSSYRVITRDVTSPATADAGADVTVSGTGFVPGETVTVELHSTPVVLGSVLANGSGEISGTFTVPAAAAGAHELVFIGSVSGATRYDITIQAVLAATGVDTGWTTSLAALLISLGAGMLVARRRLALR